MLHVPYCLWCDRYEVGTFPGGSTNFCSGECADKAAEASASPPEDYPDDGEPEGSHDLSDDADALSSAGWGTDEDYGYYGEE